MNPPKVKILTGRQEIQMSFAFRITERAGSLCWCTASTPPDDVFPYYGFTIKTPVGAGLSVPGMPRPPGELTSNWENCSLLCHEPRVVPGTGPVLSLGLGLSWLNHCVPEIPQTQIHT